MICIFKCMSCGDKMSFSMEKQAMVCPTCGSECEMDNYDMESVTYEGATTLEEGIRRLHCPSCGARVHIKEGDAMQKCGYCDAELAAFGEGQDVLCPEKIIPMKLTKEDARRKLISWWSGHSTMPRFDEFKLKVSFKDMYVPVWLIDADTVTEMSCLIKNDEYRYDHPFNNIRKVIMSNYTMVPFDSSCHIQDEQFSNIEPFNYDELVDFNAAYLSGHMAECYHNGPEITLPRAIGRLKDMSFHHAKLDIETDKMGGNISTYHKKECDVTPRTITYALVPVWVCKYVYKGVKRYIYINGQTGKVDGTVIDAGFKYENQLFTYGLSIVPVCFAIGLEIACAIKLMVPSLIEVAIAIGVIVFAVRYKWKGRDTSIDMKAAEEIQLRQGKKTKTSDYIFYNIILDMVALIVIIFGVYPKISISDVVADTMIMGGLIAVVVLLVYIYFYNNKLAKYETFSKKALYTEYINPENTSVIDSSVW